MFRHARNPLFEVRALQDVSLSIGDGERVGVLGSNGSGKSTLLRLLAGVYHPTSGRSTVEGKVSSLFELALGFEMEASGWKNIRFRGYLQGESRDGIRRKASGDRGIQRPGRLSEDPCALLLGRHDGSAGLFHRHGHRAGNPAGR